MQIPYFTSFPPINRAGGASLLVHVHVILWSLLQNVHRGGLRGDDSAGKEGRCVWKPCWPRRHPSNGALTQGLWRPWWWQGWDLPGLLWRPIPIKCPPKAAFLPVSYPWAISTGLFQMCQQESLADGMFSIGQVGWCLQQLSTTPPPQHSTAPSPTIPTQEISYESENERQNWRKKKKKKKKTTVLSRQMVWFTLTFSGLCSHSTLGPRQKMCTRR